MFAKFSLGRLSASQWVGVLVLAQVVFWSTAATLSHDAPPLDVVELSLWGPEWLISSYKNPALSSWMLEIARRLTGVVGWPDYILSELFIAATLVLIYMLGRKPLGDQRALAGTLLMTATTYFSWDTPEFNHNVAEMPFWAGVGLAAWRAVETRKIGWWLALGLFGAGAMYSKYSGALLISVVGLWLLVDGKARRTLLTPGPWLGFAIFALAVSPLLYWVAANHSQPEAFARSRGLAGAGSMPVLLFPLSKLRALVGMFVMMAIAGLLTLRAAPRTTPLSKDETRFLRYLLTLTFGPMLSAMVAAWLSGIGLRTGWGIPMLNWAGLLAITLAGTRFNEMSLRRIGATAALLLFAIPIVYAVSTIYAPAVVATGLIPGKIGANIKRANWPQKAIADGMMAIWTRETGRPLTIIAGDFWAGGLVAIASNPMPHIFTDAEPLCSPWISPQDIERDGALVVWRSEGDLKAMPKLQALIGERPRMVAKFPLARFPDLPPVSFGYAIVKPKDYATRPAG